MKTIAAPALSAASIACSPPGWTFTIVTDTIQHNSSKTPHGGTSVIAGRCPYKIVWDIGTGAAIANWRFAFDHPFPSHDVDWILSAAGGTLLTANWGSPVGGNFGPIHAPNAHLVPSTTPIGLLILLALVLFSAIFVMYKKRAASCA